MTSQNYNLLNPEAAIKNAMPNIIEAFVEFYGEEKRERIEEKLNNIIILPYQTLDDLKNMIRTITSRESEILIRNFLERANIPATKENIKKYFPESQNLINYSLNPINDYVKFIKMNKTSDDYNIAKEKAVVFLKSFYPDVTVDNVEQMMRENRFSNEEKLAELYYDLLDGFENVLISLKPYMDIEEKTNKLKDSLMAKHFNKYLQKFSNLIPNDELEKANVILSNRHSLFGVPTITAYFGNSLLDAGLITAFKSETEKYINDNSWRANSIKRDRIKFFNNLGIDLGNNYQDYENNIECQRLVPSYEMIEQLEEEKSKIKGLYEVELFNLTSTYKTNMEKIDDANLLDKNNVLDFDLYNKKCTCILPNVSADSSGIHTTSILCFNVGGELAYFDKKLIHELNHAYELNLLDIDNEKILYSSGWDILTCYTKDVNEESKNQGNRKYELINEIINELIAQRITTIMHNNGKYVFNTKEDAKVSGNTSYESTYWLIKELISEYKQEILDTRTTSDMSPLFDKIGDSNFEELNALFSKFYATFDAYKLLVLHSDLREKRDTGYTRIYNQIMVSKQSILENMRNCTRALSV